MVKALGIWSVGHWTFVYCQTTLHSLLASHTRKTKCYKRRMRLPFALIDGSVLGSLIVSHPEHLYVMMACHIKSRLWYNLAKKVYLEFIMPLHFTPGLQKLSGLEKQVKWHCKEATGQIQKMGCSMENWPNSFDKHDVMSILDVFKKMT